MKVSIIDACFPIKKQQKTGLAYQYLVWDCKRNGIEVTSIINSNIILVTTVHPQQVHFVNQIKSDKPIYIGGFGALSPFSFLKNGFKCVLGDGQNFIKSLSQGDNVDDLNNVVTSIDQKNKLIDQNFPYDMPFFIGEDKSYHIWISRGCKNRCSFCQVGWSTKYSENPNKYNLIKSLKSLTGKKINFLTNDLSQVSFYPEISSVSGSGSYSLNFLKKTGLPKARQIRMGIEGVSERIRKSCKKPISKSDLINCTRWLNENGKSVRWFLIAGLPGENIDDWRELKDSILEWKKITKKGVLALSFTAWCPDPATPISTNPINDDYYNNFMDFKKWFFEGIGFSNRIKIMQPQKPESRMIKAMYSMGLSENELYEGGKLSPNAVIVDYNKKPLKNP